MGLSINDTAPDFEADTTQGRTIFVLIADAVSDDAAKRIFGEWKSPKPYIRIVPRRGDRCVPVS